MSIPTLFIYEKAIATGKVPKTAEVKTLLRS